MKLTSESVTSVIFRTQFEIFRARCKHGEEDGVCFIFAASAFADKISMVFIVNGV